MKNTMLWAALFTVICTPIHADTTQPTNSTQTTPTDNSTSVVQPTPSSVQKAPQLPAVQTQPSTNINCDYKIPSDMKKIEQSLVITWTEKATVQAFDFDPTAIDTQMQKLKTCFTEQGWSSFDTALQKSGNVEAIKTQNLTVSSQVDGQIKVTEENDNQWKITLPLQVVYQNDKEKVTQLLNINLTVGRKVNGDLGIMQMIAAPRTVVTQQQPAATLPQDNPVNKTVDINKAKVPTNTDATNPINNNTTVDPAAKTTVTPANNPTVTPSTNVTVSPVNNTTTVTPATGNPTTPSNSSTTTTH